MARYIDADEFEQRLADKDIFFPALYKYELKSTPTADVVPKSEVEDLNRECESLRKTVNEASELIRKLRSKIDELKKDRYQMLPDGRIELLPRTDVEKIKTEVASKIFEEIEDKIEREVRFYKSVYDASDDTENLVKAKAYGRVIASGIIHDFIIELKKKYTEAVQNESHNTSRI